MNLYKVTLAGFYGSSYRESYAIANNAEGAYRKVRSFLDKHDIGVSKDRALETVELLAEPGEYPECETRLFQ